MSKSELCGKCLHSKDCHVPDNGHTMFCCACQKLCDIKTYNQTYRKGNVRIDTNSKVRIEINERIS